MPLALLKENQSIFLVFYLSCLVVSSCVLFLIATDCPCNNTLQCVCLLSGLHHIQLSERVVVGKDGNLYFAHLITDDSRDDYTCNVQYLATRTILAKEPTTLTVNPCEFCCTSTKLN